MASPRNNNTLFLGTFNSEFFWKDHQFSELPSISDRQSDNVLSVMDELLWVFCKNPNDVMITRLPLDQYYKEYLGELGYEFRNNTIPLSSGVPENGSSSATVCRLIAEHTDLQYFRNLVSEVDNYSPYSILHESGALLERLGLKTEIPDVKIVEKVNSKVFSSLLSKQLTNSKKEEIAYSANELLVMGKEMLARTPVLIKDPMGVSGKGNLLIQSEKMLGRICDHIRKQETKGKKTCFILESLLNKKTDFSSQLHISQSGDIQFVTVQIMQNKAFAFSGIQTAGNEFLRILEKADYFKQVEWIGNEIWKEGYYGPVCIDSMVDQQDTIIPIIEINARKSMGLINYHLDQYLSRFSRRGNLMYLSLMVNDKIPFEDMRKHLRESGVLFSPDNPQGILPLSASAMNINAGQTISENESHPCKARLYFSIITQKDDQEGNGLLRKLYTILDDLNVKVVH
jgi:hypothetical protein